MEVMWMMIGVRGQGVVRLLYGGLPLVPSLLCYLNDLAFSIILQIQLLSDLDICSLLFDL